MKTEQPDQIIREFIGVGKIALPDHETLDFSTSWDSLMPVVVKICQLNHTVNMIWDETFYRCQILCYNGTSLDKDIDVCGNSSPLEDTYKAVIEFINWYNKQSMNRAQRYIAGVDPISTELEDVKIEEVNKIGTGPFKWETPKCIPKTEPEHGDLRRVKLEVEVIFEWSDKIIFEVDENNNPIEYTSGYIMKVLNNQTFVYKGEKSQKIATVMCEDQMQPKHKDDIFEVGVVNGSLILSPFASVKHCKNLFIKWMKETFDKDVKIT